jgi:hypothetical protein
MSGETDVTVVTTLVCSFYFACEAAGASSARYSLRPLIKRVRKFLAKLGCMHREIAKVCLGYLKFESVVVITRESG